MKISDFMDMQVLQSIQDQFSDATGLAAIAVDAEGNYITRGSNFTEFCMKYTRGNEEGLRRCIKCDNECSGTYYCHAGLMDFSSDIVINGIKAGAIIGGQVLPGEPDLDRFAEIAGELGINEKSYLEAVKKVPVRTEASICAAAAMLGTVINQMVNLEYLKAASQKRMEVFDSEVKNVVDNVATVTKDTKDLEAIASMENILSLNASIEAGRAGEAGVGFAVVAKQMGELSKKSSDLYKRIHKAADEIAVSIKKIGNDGL